ncbi:MAG: hypothetical protein N3D73_00860 [Candidatus Diapherotrites archaeon]|nr:hypothetical protein [Candidatus Diapherotrites archaeon]
MLAYELKQMNLPDRLFLKKIFVNFIEDKIMMDKKLEEYGICYDDDINIEKIQKILEIPKITRDEAGIPDERTGTNSLKPYVELSVKIKNKKCYIEIKGDKKYSYKYDLKDHKEIPDNSKEYIKLNLDKENYFINNKNLYEEYIKCGLIDKEGRVSTENLNKVCSKFSELLKKNVEELPNQKINFILVLLPEDQKVEYRKPNEEHEKSKTNFEDALWEEAEMQRLLLSKNMQEDLNIKKETKKLNGSELS